MIHYTSVQSQEKNTTDYLGGNTSLNEKDLRKLLRQVGEKFRSTSQAKHFDVKMQQAGLPLRGSEFLVLAIGTSLSTGILIFALSGGVIIAAILGVVLAYFIFLVGVNIKIAKRLKAFNAQLGDALSMMANALRSGFSFFQTVDMVAKEMPAPLSQEFNRVMREMNLGVTTEDALINLTERIKSDDLDLMATAVLIQRQVGGNLAQILDNIGGTIRERLKMKAEIKTLTAQGRLSGWIVGLLPFILAIAMTLINPKYLQPLITEPMGKIFIVMALVSQIFGALIIKRIVDIDM